MARSINVEPRVRVLLKGDQTLRNSDKKLLLAFWAEQGFILSDRQRQVFMGVTPAGSITRARRTLRAEYPGSDDIEQARYERFKEEQADHATPKAIGWLED